MDIDLKGLFKNRYPELKGRDWLRHVDKEDRQAFIKLGLQSAEYGKLGGKARGKNGKRDNKGRFTK